MEIPPSEFAREEKKSTFVLKAFLAYSGAILCLSSVCAVFLFGVLGINYIIKNWLAPIPVETYGINETRISEKDGMVMVYVPAGEFTMGEALDKHTINVDTFWIDQTEVTNAMYAKCVNDGKCALPDSINSNTRDSYYGNPEFGRYPVIYVTWDDANSYCKWADRRLPTEAEWEKAASWDENNQEKYVYPWGNHANCFFANYWGLDGGCIGDTTKVGSYEDGKSPYGAYDMGGNVGEWVSSLYALYPYDKKDGRERESSSASDLRIVRGGAWFFPDNYMFTTYRSAPNHSLSNFSNGFRCAMSVSE